MVSRSYTGQHGGGTCLTFLIHELPGRPSSRAKAQVTREVAARTATAQNIKRTSRRAVRPVANPLEARASWKTSIKVNPVSGVRAFWMLPMQNRTVTSIPKPSTPLINTLAIKALGTAVLACRTSSLMWIAPSAPVCSFSLLRQGRPLL
jgi:hypothetical protein